MLRLAAGATAARIAGTATIATGGVAAVASSGVRSASQWSKLEKAPEDAILGITLAYNADTDANKINVGVGAYRNDDGKPEVLKSVREAERRVLDANLDLEYAPIAGVPKFVESSRNLLFGDSCTAVQEGRVASVQSISGTGALRVAAGFLKQIVGKDAVYLSDPTWANHKNIFNHAGFSGINSYRYFDKATATIDVAGMLDDLKAAPEQSVVLLHACAHNPTGQDPSMEQWAQINDVCKERNHICFFDSAYQGFASGDPVKDAAALRYFVDQGHEIIASQSFAKNMGLYGVRVGALHVVADSPERKAVVESQLKVIVRPMYSNPPISGARVVAEILGDAQLHQQWDKEVKGMADRIITMRQTLKDGLAAAGSTKDWNHITSQIGMFCYSGLTPDQVARMRDEFHVYMTSDGRISMAGVTSKNVGHLAKAMHAVTSS